LVLGESEAAFALTANPAVADEVPPNTVVAFDVASWSLPRPGEA
jgi:hypothetical protein